MTIFDNILGKIQKGQQGLNTGIPHGFDRLTPYIPDINKETYWVIAGESSTGKTSLADQLFFYTPFEYTLLNETDIKVEFIYNTLEIPKDRKLTKGISRKLFLDYGITADSNLILSRGKNRISNELYTKVIFYKEYFDRIADKTIFSDKMTPESYAKTLRKYAESRGRFVQIGNEEIYSPNNPNLYTFVITDTYGLVKATGGKSKKQTIDAISEIGIEYRNKCKFIIVPVVQFNRSISSTDRFKLQMLEPQSSDIKETSNIFEDADIVFGLFNPYRYNLEEYKGYDITKLRDGFRSVKIMKSRDGEADKTLGAGFHGASGTFYTIPLPENITYNE